MQAIDRACKFESCIVAHHKASKRTGRLGCRKRIADSLCHVYSINNRFHPYSLNIFGLCDTFIVPLQVTIAVAGLISSGSILFVELNNPTTVI
jgi:hypothetical protein